MAWDNFTPQEIFHPETDPVNAETADTLQRAVYENAEVLQNDIRLAAQMFKELGEFKNAIARLVASGDKSSEETEPLCTAVDSLILRLHSWHNALDESRFNALTEEMNAQKIEDAQRFFETHPEGGNLFIRHKQTMGKFVFGNNGPLDVTAYETEGYDFYRFPENAVITEYGAPQSQHGVGKTLGDAVKNALLEERHSPASVVAESHEGLRKQSMPHDIRTEESFQAETSVVTFISHFEVTDQRQRPDGTWETLVQVQWAHYKTAEKPTVS